MGKGKKYKKDFGYSYSFGVYPTLELLKYRPDLVLEIFISSKGFKNEGVGKIQQLADEKGIKVETHDGFVESISGSDNTYAAAVFKKYDSLIEDVNHLVLLSPEDAGNLGTIIRTMVGFGFKNLALIKPAVDIWEPKAVRASMGAIFQVNFQYFGSFEEYTSKFPSHSKYLFTSEGKEALKNLKASPPMSLVFGSESAGLAEPIRRKGTTVAIPFEKTIDSLPLPISVGAVLYKIYEQS